MEYRKLGNTGLRVSNLCLGTMTFGASDDRPGQCTEEVSFEIMDAYVKAGGNFIDTANVYQFGESERIIGNWMKARGNRDNLVVATKVAGVMNIKDPNGLGLSRKHIMDQVEASLARLQTSYIDVFYVHCWDESTPIKESLTALTDLVRAGKVRYIGASNFTGWQVQLAACTSDRWLLERFCCLQEQYNLIVREVEWEVTDVCAREGLGLIPWSPLKGGWLSGKIKRPEEGGAPEGSRIGHASAKGKSNQSAASYDSLSGDERTWRILDKCSEIAKAHGVSVAEVALRWLTQKPNVPSVIMGVKNLTQLNSNLSCMKFKLTEEQMLDLDEASKLPMPYPYEMIARANAARKALGHV